jgi:hypothetical protein
MSRKGFTLDLFFVVALVVVTGGILHSESPPDLEADEDLEISLRKTSCLGNCPSYSVRITGNGSVTYEGLNKESADISQDKVQRLLDKFYEEDFFKMKESKHEMTDDSDTVISLEASGYSKSLLYDGASAFHPDSDKFRSLEEEIKRVANITSEDIQEAKPQAPENTQAEINIEYAYNHSGSIIFTLRNTGIEPLPLKSGNQKNLTLYANGRPVGSNDKGWNFTNVNHSKEEDLYLAPAEAVEINTSVNYPENNSSIGLEINGPFKTSDKFLCYNSGTSSC